jgi:hypothetical protein
MKEGYLQMKIAELNEKCKNIDQIINIEKSKLILLQEQVGGFKELLKKLKDIDEFKKKTISIIKNENEQILNDKIIKLSKQISETYKNSFKSKNNKIDGFLQNIDNIINEQKIIEEKFNKKMDEIEYLLEHNNLLMMKLANKGIISEREINEMNTRSLKRVKNK